MNNEQQTPPPITPSPSTQPTKPKRKLGLLAWLGIIVGGFFLLAIIGAVMSGPQASNPSASNSSASAPDKPTKQEWKAKLGQSNGLFRQTGSNLVMQKAQFVQLMGQPDTTQTVGDSTFWYYDCSDGTIQVAVDTSTMNMAGLMQGDVNDY